MKSLFMKVLLLLLLSIVFGNVSFATIQPQYWSQFNYSGSLSDFTEYLFESTFHMTFDEFAANIQINPATTTSANNFTTCFNNYYDTTTYNSYYWVAEYSSNSYGASPNRIYFYLSNNNFSSNGYKTFIVYRYGNGKYYCDSFTNNNNGLSVGGNINNTYPYRFLKTSDNWYYNPNNRINNPILRLNFDTTGYNSGTITASSINFLKYVKSRSVNYWDLGEFVNLSIPETVYCSILIYNGDSTFSEVARLNYRPVSDTSLISNGLIINSSKLSVDNSFIYYNQGYRLSISYDGRNGQNNGTIPPIDIYFVSPENSSSSSGELINNDINNNNNLSIIQNLNNNNDFWKETYDNMFVLSSGDVSEIVTMVEAYFPSGDTPLSVYDMIFGSINNEPEDFIIRWDNIPMFFTTGGGNDTYSGDFIQANSINFSKLCRDNETFGLVQFWIRILSVIAFYIIFIFSFYKCILVIFGVYSGIIDTPVEESRQIGFINDWRDK